MKYLLNIQQKDGFIYLLIGILFLSACNKLVEVNPPVTSTNAGLVYASDISATAGLTGIYTAMSQDGVINGPASLSLYPALSADELTLFSEVTDPAYIGYYQNSLTSVNPGNFWSSIYSSNYIYAANAAIEGLDASSSLTPAVKQELLGEAKFIRAFCYFYLVNLYGDVPLVLTTNYKINASIGRTDKADVYKQIILDLKDAETLLGDNYLDVTLLRTSSERVVPNKWAAKAMLSRAYLYTNDWVNAETEASNVINNTALYDTVSVNDVFLVNNRESIWQLQSVNGAFANTSDALLFILHVTGPNNSGSPVYLSESLKNSFELGDKRKDAWLDSVNVAGTTYVYPAKYKLNQMASISSERTVILRLAEQYLIRAEARAKQTNLAEAVLDLNLIRRRAGLPPTTASTQADLLNAILHERQVELFIEWGHRWLDLKRTGNADAILKPIKGSNWQTTDQLYPIPQSDIDKNPSLKGKQNPGY
jgi:hypothetical protein